MHIQWHSLSVAQQSNVFVMCTFARAVVGKARLSFHSLILQVKNVESSQNSITLLLKASSCSDTFPKLTRI